MHGMLLLSQKKAFQNKILGKDRQKDNITTSRLEWLRRDSGGFQEGHPRAQGMIEILNGSKKAVDEDVLMRP